MLACSHWEKEGGVQCEEESTEENSEGRQQAKWCEHDPRSTNQERFRTILIPFVINKILLCIVKLINCDTNVNVIDGIGILKKK